jgi:hypothetical protein
VTDLVKVRPIITMATAMVFEATAEALRHWGESGERPLDQAHRCFQTAQDILRDGIAALYLRTGYPEMPFGARWLLLHYAHYIGVQDAEWNGIVISVSHVSACIRALREAQHDRPPVDRLNAAAELCESIARFIKVRVDARVRICTT